MEANTKHDIDGEWHFPREIWDCLSPYERSFFENEFKGEKSIEYYTQRLRAIGFEGDNNVLDAACGMGQWSAALGKLNKSVEGIDINTGRLLIAKELVKSLQLNNCNFKYASLESLPYEDDSFDGIFCYGAFMFSDMPQTLREFRRVLKPDGKLYVNANTYGWYAHLIIDRGICKRDFNMILSSSKMIMNTMLGKNKNIVVRERWLRTQLQMIGFENITFAAEGTLNHSKNFSLPKPAYPAKYYGMPGIVEVSCNLGSSI